ncbi:hypothetical protein SAMN04487775_10923 [Treponema bryantii]|uniref:Lipoprotein n=1 Tax=Treponema bryantii TaxID=163 RepID=A0A1I3MGM3_9SPIR|nr:hypothetical protein [Treponema bryantii]SFI96071.1 hypothetical protein SAMN04487775_10923 [Treponema bryantii]
MKKYNIFLAVLFTAVVLSLSACKQQAEVIDANVVDHYTDYYDYTYSVSGTLKDGNTTYTVLGQATFNGYTKPTEDTNLLDVYSNISITLFDENGSYVTSRSTYTYNYSPTKSIGQNNLGIDYMGILNGKLVTAVKKDGIKQFDSTVFNGTFDDPSFTYSNTYTYNTYNSSTSSYDTSAVQVASFTFTKL